MGNWLYFSFHISFGETLYILISFSWMFYNYVSNIFCHHKLIICKLSSHKNIMNLLEKVDFSLWIFHSQRMHNCTKKTRITKTSWKDINFDKNNCTICASLSNCPQKPPPPPQMLLHFLDFLEILLLLNRSILTH